MKRSAYFLCFFLAFIFLSTGISFGQNGNKTFKGKRNSEQLDLKKNSEHDRSVSRAYYTELLKKRNFVLAADFAMNERGLTFIVNPDINFVSVVNDTVTFQFGRPGVAGYNGVGGVTAHGTVMSYKFTPGKKKNGMMVTSGVRLRGPGDPPNFTLYVSDDGNARMIINFAGQLITLSGHIYSAEDSGIYVGQSPF